MDITKTQAASSISGFQDLGTATGSITIGSYSSPVHSTQAFSFNVPFSRNDVISVMRIQVLGLSAPIGNYWYPLQGSLTFNDVSDGLQVNFTVTSAGSGRTITVTLYNNTAGATVIVPTLTINAYAHIYSFPF